MCRLARAFHFGVNNNACGLKCQLLMAELLHSADGLVKKPCWHLGCKKMTMLISGEGQGGMWSRARLTSRMC